MRSIDIDILRIMASGIYAVTRTDGSVYRVRIKKEGQRNFVLTTRDGDLRDFLCGRGAVKLESLE